MSVCPVTGNQCGKPPIFVITEMLGDKSQTTSCCRDCASGHVERRNAATRSGLEEILGMLASVAKECPGCGSTLGAIIARNQLGCEQCAQAFSGVMCPVVIQRRVSLDSLPIDQRIDILGNSLKAAIDREDYEKAAEFRDLINKVKESSTD